MASLFTRRNQLQWLALLAIAVVLPTVSLLWFMSRVIANERLVVPQKLAVLYKDKVADATARTESLYAARLADFDALKPGANPYSLFRHLVLEGHVQGAVLWDENGALQYPQAVDVTGSGAFSENPLAEAWQLEFAKRQYAAGAEAYGKFTTHNDPRVAITAITGKTRCLSRQGKLDEAIETCQKAAASPQVTEKPDPALRLAIVNARLLLLSLLKQSGPSESNSALFQKTADALMGDLYNGTGEQALPANQNLFIAKKLLDAQQGPFHFSDARAKSQLETLATAEELSIAAAEALRHFAGQPDVFIKLTLAEKPIYALRHQIGSSTLLVLWSEDGIASLLSGFGETFSGTESAYRILDGSGDFVAGAARTDGKPYNVAPLPPGFPGWKAELYFEGGNVFEKAAQRQIAVYTWTGFLVIVLIFIAGGFATRAVGRQIRLNEMKNDFIATVTHELKTPLASMRVLVDTMLEGNVVDEAQRTKYLQLTARENERLSRMIDNFLTFSRMERNKIAFTFADARPEAMARDALEAVQTKYAALNCHLAVDIAKELPEIQADHDTIVTVLLNLLDNACKYTGENKQVSLRVFSDTDSVYFAVADNGVGLARRHLRRIFDRFYQVDSSLARKAEGCGLGLSIVKFIVDAHKGKVSVESKPGQGSTFTVKLPVGERTAIEGNQAMETVLIVEDDPTMLLGLKDNFEFKGYKVVTATDGEKGLKAALNARPDLIILDIMLPKINGYEICRLIREEKLQTPIIMLTAKGEESDVVLGLNLGADDYVTKPFSIKELLARAAAFLRRAKKDVHDVYEFGGMQLDLSARRLTRKHKEIELSPKEFSLLKYFVTKPGRALTRDDILNAVWGYDCVVTSRSIDRFVTTLRNKIEPDPAKPVFIHTIRQIGYRFEPPEQKS